MKKCNRKPPDVLPNYFGVDRNYYIEPVARSRYVSGVSSSKTEMEGVDNHDQQLGELKEEGFSKLIEKIVRVHGKCFF